MARAAYRDPDYRAAEDALRLYGAACRCGAPATTLDHVPPLALHRHVRGSGCCRYVPACRPCNLGAGAAIASARRSARRPGASRRW